MRLRLSRERPVTLRTHCLASASTHMRLHAPRDCLGCTAHPSTDATSGPLAWQMCAPGGLLCAVVLRAWRSVLYRWHSLLFRDRRRQSSGCWFIGVMARLSLPDPGERGVPTRAMEAPWSLPPVGSLVCYITLYVISLTFSWRSASARPTHRCEVAARPVSRPRESLAVCDMCAQCQCAVSCG